MSKYSISTLNRIIYISRHYLLNIFESYEKLNIHLKDIQF